MATSTALDIINKALLRIGVGAEGEDVTGSQAQDALDALNNMLSSWGARSFLTTNIEQESFALTVDVNNYSIGSNQTFDTEKPLTIVGGFVRDSGNNDYPISVIPKNVYNDIFDKSISSSRPTRLYYDTGITQQANQAGTIYLYPPPDNTSTYTLFIDSEKNLTEFSSLTSSVTVPAFYKRALINNLAIEVAADYGRAVSPDIVAIASESLETIRKINSKNKQGEMTLNYPTYQGVGNIYSDIRR